MQREWGLNTFSVKQNPAGIVIDLIMAAPDIHINTMANVCHIHKDCT